MDKCFSFSIQLILYFQVDSALVDEPKVAVNLDAYKWSVASSTDVTIDDNSTDTPRVLSYYPISRDPATEKKRNVSAVLQHIYDVEDENDDDVNDDNSVYLDSAAVEARDCLVTLITVLLNAEDTKTQVIRERELKREKYNQHRVRSAASLGIESPLGCGQIQTRQETSLGACVSSMLHVCLNNLDSVDAWWDEVSAISSRALELSLLTGLRAGAMLHCVSHDTSSGSNSIFDPASVVSGVLLATGEMTLEESET
jgi:hypothetical protein